ncbi:solute carrier family 23 protein [Longimicrobium terrae]|uniref:Uracil-xanthine permease n=1 Tax=Longimicrobium terrae TaxID=1639882 RepID=A0A841GWK6_9BACT|nr:solute carrier family 23 protein [Longimicrobium terrae]MBB4634414.1 uracil-xanthine permease [Longimicrobium terrae]MBB6068696.1 uracil-xanthine permease [Longimicrobium terrae]NNC27882.1 pyrimidine utilization transport protein G [Longimicrobium terrae]
MRDSAPQGFFPRWTVKADGVIGPEERLPWGQTVVVGLQHVFAMFGATVLVPILMGFDPNTSVFFSGIGTLLFFVIVGGRVPSYLGSSFSFVAISLAATGYAGTGPNPNIGVALGGIIAAGALYALIGLIVMATGYRWIERLMPPVVTGSVVAVIGLNLAPVAVKAISANGFDTSIGLLTILATGAVAVYAPGLLKRVPILLGGIIGYLLYLVLANGMGLGPAVNFAPLREAAWIGFPHFSRPVFRWDVALLFAPAALILVAENLGHVKAVGAMTGQSLDRYLGRAFVGDGLATMLAAAGGGTGVTTYAENIGVMAVTRIYSTLVFVIAALAAIVMGMSPKFGALIGTIPGPVLGGLSVVLFGLIAATGGRIWVQNQVDFSNSRNLITAAVTLTMGAGDLILKLGDFSVGGIGTATFGAIIIYQLLREPASRHDGLGTADSGVADPHAPAEALPPRAVPG